MFFSRHDNAQASLALLMWLNENVLAIRYGQETKMGTL